MAVRPLQLEDEIVLLGLYPAVFGREGGLFGSVSRDGVRWSRPYKLLSSRVWTDVRTTDHPVEMVTAEPTRIDAARPRVRVCIQHRAEVGNTRNRHCQNRPPSFIRHYMLHLQPLLDALPPAKVASTFGGARAAV